MRLTLPHNVYCCFASSSRNDSKIIMTLEIKTLAHFIVLDHLIKIILLLRNFLLKFYVICSSNITAQIWFLTQNFFYNIILSLISLVISDVNMAFSLLIQNTQQWMFIIWKIIKQPFHKTHTYSIKISYLIQTHYKEL